MRTFLNQPDATFYHVTTIEAWTGIIAERRFHSPSGRIFVSRVGELPVLAAIALEQLPEINDTSEVVFLKFPQAKNNFLPEEIRPDNQALVEWSRPFQYIIRRQIIPVENIELMMTLRFRDESHKTFLLTELSRISNQGCENYPSHSIMR